jgi:hypothetical protein
MHFNTLTKNAVEPFKQKQKYFFSKGKKDNLTVFIFGHFKNVHFGKLTPNVFQTFVSEREEPLKMNLSTWGLVGFSIIM